MVVWGELNGKTYTNADEMYDDISKIIGNKDSSIATILSKWDRITRGCAISDTIYRIKITQRNSIDASIFLVIIAIILMLVVFRYP
jgi:RNAse (barnase) inhibitor barstar